MSNTHTLGLTSQSPFRLASLQKLQIANHCNPSYRENMYTFHTLVIALDDPIYVLYLPSALHSKLHNLASIIFSFMLLIINEVHNVIKPGDHRNRLQRNNPQWNTRWIAIKHVPAMTGWITRQPYISTTSWITHSNHFHYYFYNHRNSNLLWT